MCSTGVMLPWCHCCILGGMPVCKPRPCCAKLQRSSLSGWCTSTCTLVPATAACFADGVADSSTTLQLLFQHTRTAHPVRASPKSQIFRSQFALTSRLLGLRSLCKTLALCTYLSPRSTYSTPREGQQQNGQQGLGAAVQTCTCSRV